MEHEDYTPGTNIDPENSVGYQGATSQETHVPISTTAEQPTDHTSVDDETVQEQRQHEKQAKAAEKLVHPKGLRRIGEAAITQIQVIKGAGFKESLQYGFNKAVNELRLQAITPLKAIEYSKKARAERRVEAKRKKEIRKTLRRARVNEGIRNIHRENSRKIDNARYRTS